MRKVILLLLALAAGASAALPSVTLPNEDINGVDTPQVVWVDQNFDSLKVGVNRTIDTVNGLQAGTAAFTGLTASLPIFTNSSKRPVSNAMTGTGSVVMSSAPTIAGPTLTGTLTAAAGIFSSTLGVTGVQTNAQDLVFSASRAIRRDVGTGSLDLSGGSSASDGANLSLFGGSHATTAGDWRLRSGSTDRLVWDESATQLTLTGQLSASGTVTVDSLISAKFYAEGTWTATFTGMTTSVTGTARYVRVGKLVTLYLPFLSGTSNSTAGNITGMPSAIWPARAQSIPIPGFLTDDGNSVGTGITPYLSIATTGDISFGYRTDGASSGAVGAWFTASGTKGLSAITLSYTMQ